MPAPPPEEYHPPWTFEVFGGVGFKYPGSPAVAGNGAIFAMGFERPDGENPYLTCLYAVNPDGSPGRKVCGAPQYHGGRAAASAWGSGYGLDADGGLYAMLPGGVDIYRVIPGTSGPIGVTPEGYVLAGGSRIRAIAPQSLPNVSPIVWEVPAATSDILVAPDGTIYAFGFGAIGVYRSDGSHVWGTGFGRTGDALGAVDGAGNAYEASSHDLYAVSPQGRLLWSHHSEAPSPHGVGLDANVAYWISEAEVVAFDSFGHSIWSFKPKFPPATAPVVGPNGTIYVCDAGGNFYSLDSTGRVVRVLHLDSPCGRPTLGGASLYVITTRGSLIPIPY